MSILPTKIFYAHSTHSGEEYFDDALTEKLTNSGYHLLNVDEQDTSYLIDNIHKAIKNCDVVICNITPDAIQVDTDGKLHLCNNSNVIYEYGYAMALDKKFVAVFNKSKNPDYELPASLKALQYTDYSDSTEYAIENVCDIIQRYVYGNKHREQLTHVDYDLSHEFINSLNMICDITITDHNIAVDKKNKKVIIFLDGNKTTHLRYIDISSRIFYNSAKNQTKDLSTISNINDELRHLEILAHLSWFKSDV